MRIGSIQITRLKRNAQGERVYPWELVTLDQLSEEARQLIAKMARAVFRDVVGDLREDLREEIRRERAERPQTPAMLECAVCGGPIYPHAAWDVSGNHRPMHRTKQECDAYRTAVPAEPPKGSPCVHCGQPLDGSTMAVQLPNGFFAHATLGECGPRADREEQQA